MSKCSFCGGEIVDNRCTDCGMPYYNEKKYTLRSERPGEHAHDRDARGETALHRMREMAKRPAYARRPAQTERPAPPKRPPRRGEAAGKKRLGQIVGWLVLVIVLVEILPLLLVSCSV